MEASLKHTNMQQGFSWTSSALPIYFYLAFLITPQNSSGNIPKKSGFI